MSNKITHLIYSHHHADHAGASSLFDKNVTRIGQEETRRLLLRDDDPARPPNEETFQDRRTRETVSGVHRGEQRALYDARRDEGIPAHGMRLVVIKPSDLDAAARGCLRRNMDHDLGAIRRQLGT